MGNTPWATHNKMKKIIRLRLDKESLCPVLDRYQRSAPKRKVAIEDAEKAHWAGKDIS